LASQHSLYLIHNFPSGHQISSVLCCSYVTKCEDGVTEMEFDWPMET